MVKLIAMDIDGTVRHDDAATIEPAYFDVVRQLTDRGIKVCIASGRQYASLCSLFEPVQDRLMFITENGAHIVYEGKTIFHEPMTMDDSRQIVLDTRAIPNAQSLYCTKDVTYFEPKDQEAYDIMRSKFFFRCKMVDDLLALDVPCLKYSLYLREHVEEITAKEFNPKWEKTHDVACGGKYFMDVMKSGVNKGRAMKFLQEYLGMKKEETMVFGDNINDLEMFDEAGISYAVRNAREEVRKRADYVTASNNEDGVLEVLRLFNAKIDKKSGTA